MKSRGVIKSSIKIALVYVVISALWIYTSDYFASMIAKSASDLTLIQNYKGIFFVLISGIIIYLLIHRELKKQKQLTNLISEENKLHTSLIENLPHVDVFLFNPAKEVLFYKGREIEEISIEPKSSSQIKKINDIPLDKSTVEKLSLICDEVLLGKDIKHELNYLGNYYEVRGTALINENNEIHSGLLILINITSQKHLIRDLNERMTEYEALYEEYLSQSESLKKGYNELQDLNDNLADSEKKYRTFIEQTNDGIYHFKLNEPLDISLPVQEQVKDFYYNTYLADCNDTFVKMYGAKSRKEIIGKRLIDFYGGDEETNLRTNTSFVKNNYKLINQETVEVDQSGNKIYFLNNTIGMLKDNHLMSVWGTQTDITKQKQYQKELIKAKETAQRNEQKYYDLFNNLNDAVILYDLDKNNYPNKVYEANDELCKLLMISREELLSTKVSKLIEPSQYRLVEQRGMRHSQGESQTFEVNLVNSEKEIITVETKTNVVEYGGKKLILAIIRDIRERKAAEQNIQNSYQFVQNIINSFSEAIAVFDQEMNCTYYNQSMKDLIVQDSTQHKVCSKSISEFAGFSEASLKDYFDKALKGEICHTDDFELSSRKGKWYYASFIPNLNTQGNVIGIIVIITNVSERKKMELDLEAERDKAQQSDHLKSAFLANMSHEIRTPMNSIIGFSEMLEDQDVSDEERMQYSGIIRTNSSNLLRIIDDILNIAKIETQQVAYYYSSFPLNKLVEELAANLKMLINRKGKDVGVIVDKGFEDAEDTVYSDKERLYQVLTNLITNAEKFTEKGKIKISYQLVKKKIVFQVEDSGIGIAAEVQKSIFERFRQGSDEYQTRKYGGTGLGLPIAKGILQGMEGEISVASEPGKGATFTFSVPYREKPEQ
ncbi:MAG TPA: ATP-binding protein [Bacteroidales bacterium]|nr:ATP-binding protein [Bacteroidales bacterium]